MNKIRIIDTKEFDWKPIIPDKGVITMYIEFLYYGISPLRELEK